MFGATEGEGHRDMRRQGTLTFNERDRKAAVAKTARWTAEQAERLVYSPDELLAAIHRGWTAEEVEALAVAEADRLNGPPPRAHADSELIAKLNAAPILPIRDTGNRNRCRRVYLDGPSPYRRVKRELVVAE